MDASAELRQAIRRKDDAYRAGNLASYLTAYAPDITVFFAGSMLTFDEMRQLIAVQFEGGGKTLDFQIADPDHIQFSENGLAPPYSKPRDRRPELRRQVGPLQIEQAAGASPPDQRNAQRELP